MKFLAFIFRIWHFPGFRKVFNFYACMLVDYYWKRDAPEVEYKRKRKRSSEEVRSKHLYTSLDKKHNFATYFIYNILFVFF